MEKLAKKTPIEVIEPDEILPSQKEKQTLDKVSQQLIDLIADKVYVEKLNLKARDIRELASAVSLLRERQDEVGFVIQNFEQKLIEDI